MATQQVEVVDAGTGTTYVCGSAVVVQWSDPVGALDRACADEADELLELAWVPAFPAAAALLGAGMLLWPRRRGADDREPAASG